MKMKGVWGIVVSLLVLVWFVAAACGPAATPTPVKVAPTPTPLPPIKIGVLFSQTGAMSPFELLYREGALLAVDEINAAGGINGQRIEVVDYDAESNTEVAITKLKKLIKEDGVVVVVGPGTSYVHNAMIPVIDELEFPVMAVSGAFGPGGFYGPKVPKWSFSVETGAVEMMEGVMKFWQKQGIKTFVYLTTADSSGQLFDSVVGIYAPKYGMTVLSSEKRPVTDTEFTAVWAKLLAYKSDAVWVLATPPSFVTPALNTLADLGWNGPIGYDGGGRLQSMMKGVSAKAGKNFIMTSLPGIDPEGAIAPGSPLPQVVKDKVTKFAQAYRAKYNKDPEIASNGHTAMMMVADAIRAVGTDKAKIRDWLENSVKDYWGSTGVRYDNNPEFHDGVNIPGLALYSWDGDAKKFRIKDWVP